MTELIAQNISIALYRYLCQNIVGTEDYIKQIRLLNTVRDNLTSNKISTYITSGSFGEGLEIRGSDLDIMMVHKLYEVYEVTKPHFNPIVDYFAIDTSDTKAGFSRLQLVGNRGGFYMSEELNGKHYLSNVFFKLIHWIMHDKRNTIHGPCLSGEGGLLDHCICLHCPTWVSSAAQWITRPSHSWPSYNVKQSILKHGVLFVPIGIKESPNEDKEWRISFSVGEKLLIHTFTHTQLLCYALLKIMLKDVIASYSECKDLLCSYFMKTIMFWISEELSKSSWKPSNLISCFLRCFRRLIYCVEYSVCWHYFIPENNLFEYKIKGRAREILLEKLYTLHSYGWQCILFSDQISNFHGTMWNLQIKPHTTVSNTVEKILNSRALRHLDYSFASTKIKSMNMLNRGINQIVACLQYPMKYMYAYYMSKGSFLRAQFLLSYSTLDKNKYKYKQYNSCISTLLQNIYHDAVSGWLMLASFFYKTQQYSKALQIIMYSISKCTHEKLFPFMHMLDIHHQLLKLKSFEKKEDTVYLWKKLLVDDISFARHSQLIPDELPMNEDNPPRFIPSVAYAYFLGFLCHYHLNNFRQCQDLLKDLQRIIAEQYLIADSRDKPCHLVGAALQLLGNQRSYNM